MHSTSRFVLSPLLFLLLAIGAPPAGKAHTALQAAAPTHQSSSIACRVMERHADKEHSTVLILFHQRDKPDQPKLKEFLLQHDGGTIQIQIGAGEWQKAAVWRIRNCFGRGLLVLPDTASPKEHSTFSIRAVQ